LFPSTKPHSKSRAAPITGNNSVEVKVIINSKEQNAKALHLNFSSAKYSNLCSKSYDQIKLP
jgi:hypothetical protein